MRTRRAPFGNLKISSSDNPLNKSNVTGVVRRECVKLTHPMAFLDLASPRDIDMQLKDVTLLLNLDSLNAIVAKNQATRERLLQQGQGMIEEALQETIDWLGSTEW